MRRRGIGGAFCAAAVLVSILPASGSAAVTVGADMSIVSNVGGSCPSSLNCTFAQTGGGARYVSPIDGVVVRWRLKEDSNPGNLVNLRIVRPNGAGAFTGTGRSATEVTDAEGQVFGGAPFQTFPTRLPIKMGDRLGLDGPFANMSLTRFDAGLTESESKFDPTLQEGGSARAPDTVSGTRVLLINADVEADADCDAFGDETQDPVVSGGCAPPKAATLTGGSFKTKGKNLSLGLSCALVGGNCDSNQLLLRSAKRLRLGKAALARKRKRGKKVTLGSASFSIPAGQSQTVVLPLSKGGRKLLRLRRKVSAIATVTGGGTNSTAPLKVRRQSKKRRR